MTQAEPAQLKACYKCGETLHSIEEALVHICKFNTMVEQNIAKEFFFRSQMAPKAKTTATLA